MADDYDRIFPKNPRDSNYARYETLDPSEFALDAMGEISLIKLQEMLRIATQRGVDEADNSAALEITTKAITDRIDELSNRSLLIAADFGADVIKLRGNIAHLAIETIPEGEPVADPAIIDELELAISGETGQTAA